MTLAEKAGILLHGLFSAGKGRKEERKKNGRLKTASVQYHFAFDV
jgi:hypothetical protein